MRLYTLIEQDVHQPMTEQIVCDNLEELRFFLLSDASNQANVKFRRLYEVTSENKSLAGVAIEERNGRHVKWIILESPELDRMKKGVLC